MDQIQHLDPVADPHLVAVLCERSSSFEGSYWKVSIAGRGIVEVGFDQALDKHLQRGQVLWLWDVAFLEPRHAVATLTAGSRISFRPHHQAKTTDARIVELFSGFAGWTHGARLLGREVSYMIEIDAETAKAAGAATDIPVFHFEDFWKNFLVDGFIPDQAIFIGDANDDRMWTILSIRNVRHVLFSTNCQPWSSIGYQRGLNVQAGINTPAMFRKGRDYGMATMTLENVKGFRLHPHFKVIRQFAEQVGFELAHHSVDNCSGVLPLIRDRWLGTFIDRSLSPHVTPEARFHASQIQFPSDPFLGGLVGYGALFHEIPEEHLQELTPDEFAVERLSDPQLVPEWWGKKCVDGMSCRLVANNMPWKGLVASYGKQHCLDVDLLKTKGLHTCLLRSSGGPRYISPWEAAAALGLPNNITLPLDLGLCWKLVGNGLSVAHAILQLSRLHALCRELSPFSAIEVPSIVYLCRAMQRKGLKLVGFTPISTAAHRVLVDSSKPDSPVDDWPWSDTSGNQNGVDGKRECNKDDRPHPTIDHEFFRPTKWLKKHGFTDITPTIPYEVTEEQEKPCPKVGLQFLPAPSFRELLDQCRMVEKVEVTNSIGQKLHIVLFASTVTRWTLMTWAPHGKTVLKLFCMVFPHFRIAHVKDLIDHDTEVEWDMVPFSNPFRIFRFCPVDVLCQLELTCDKHQMIVHVANVTTKVSDWISSFAARYCVSACMLELHLHGVKLGNDTFVLAHGTKNFSLHWVVPSHIPVDPKCVEEDHEKVDHRSAVECQVPQNDDELACFCVKHPIWNSIRTMAAVPSNSIAVVLAGMLPDLTIGDSPIVRAGDFTFPATVKICELPVGQSITVELNGKQPLPTVVVHQFPFQVGLCLASSTTNVGPGLFRRWIRSPFKVQATEMDLQGDMTLLTLGSSFFTKVTSPQTLLVTLNGRTVDPCLTIRETSSEVTIAFRCCPLPGGAKNDLAGTISQALQTRGVPAEAVDARTKSVLATIPQDQLRSHIKEPEVTFWASLKRLASEHKIRLVTTQELKAFQKGQRTDKKSPVADDPPSKGKGKGANGNQSKGKGKGAAQSRPQLDLAHKLETQYLQAEGVKPIPVLPKVDFGVDQVGVTLMTEKEANAFFPIKSLSTGPLAILALCETDSMTSDIVMLPAVNKAGEPILLPVTIHNFGDVPVKFHPGDKNANATAVETQVVEVTIRRALVEDWSKVRDGLQYLASANPALKGGSVIAHWSFKSYNSNKKPAAFDQASYVHGYFRCKADCIDDVLKSSGKHGIFTVPRDESRRPDPAFAIIPASEKLEHMLIQAQKHVTTLGVVEVNGSYAYRTRRENLQTLRRALMPNSVWSEEGQPRAGDEMYVLKHVAIATGAPQLSKALQQLGWDAVGIRPIGQTTWSVAAAHPPPSPHLLINGQFTIAVPARENKKGPEVFRTLASFRPGVAISAVPTTIADDDMGTNSNQQSRFHELKQDLRDQINQLVEKKFQETQEQVGVLSFD